ncbi:MAG TPA: selenide, water dikinase SelD, partial [Desulfuromonadaceae bacterium]
IADGMVPAGCYRNRDHYAGAVTDESGRYEILPLFDPQTSGGLLISLPGPETARFMDLAAARNCFAVCIGEVLERGERPIEFA